LEDLREQDITQMFVEIPADRISAAAAEFAKAIIQFNKEKLLNIGR
jgi:hypothetical protein